MVRMKKVFSSLAILILAVLFYPGQASAVPEIAGLKITDLTATSFSIVWMTNVEGEPGVEVYSDPQMMNSLTSRVMITTMPGAGSATRSAALGKGNMKVMVSGLASNTTYYVRAAMADPQAQSGIGYSSLEEVTTASKAVPYKDANGVAVSLSNDLVTFRSYMPEANPDNGSGDLMLLEIPGVEYPLSAFVGEGVRAPEALFDLNNLYGADGFSADVPGGDRIVIRIYKGGLVSAVLHYRRLAQNSGFAAASEPLKGYFADVNVDGKVDDGDFELFKVQYGTVSSDSGFNPDFDFVEDAAGAIDVKDFSRFSVEYGKQGL